MTSAGLVMMACALVAAPPLALAQVATPSLPTPTTSAAPTVPAPIDRAAFATWLADMRVEAVTRGVSQATVDRALTDLEPVDQVLQRDRSQAEFTLTLESYLKRRLTPATIRLARQMAIRHRAVLTRAEKTYDVDARILVAVWGLESNFGRFSGVRPTLPVLATLAWDGRRGEFFRRQLFDALTIVDRGYIELESLKGSWAGALGQVQFLPSSYLAWAVDFDDDGDRDVWTSMPDVFGSIGNYLQQHGWKLGRWGYRVKVPARARNKVAAVPMRQEGCRAARSLSQPRSLKGWRTLGVTLADGTRVPASPQVASLLEIESRAYLVTANYEALLAYNCAHTYALSVALLADRLPVVR